MHLHICEELKRLWDVLLGTWTYSYCSTLLLWIEISFYIKLFPSKCTMANTSFSPLCIIQSEEEASKIKKTMNVVWCGCSSTKTKTQHSDWWPMATSHHIRAATSPPIHHCYTRRLHPSISDPCSLCDCIILRVLSPQKPNVKNECYFRWI